MDAKDLTLNIAVNLGRIARWSRQNRLNRVKQFMNETEGYLKQLEKVPKNDRFLPTMKTFKAKFQEIKNYSNIDKNWTEDVLTWANILTHRAKLATP